MAGTPRTSTPAIPDPPSASLLARLLRPALVAIVGPPNIGKSSLLNALAGRTVALVADAPGTTRDSVGVGLIVDGLLVRYLDTPGLSDTPRDALDAEAQRAAHAVLARADLLLLAADARHPETLASTRALARQALGQDASRPTIEVLLRSDLAHAATMAETDGSASHGTPVATSSRTGQGLSALASAIRTTLLPDAALRDTTPWRFWAS
ncbi:MAG: 50S ribosome-binding GTPase [Phycisphaerales bacterium]|nr:50S ribosome-binding GTPase [Phycisphaerales bacterium]